jgi:hypothetical protein
MAWSRRVVLDLLQGGAFLLELPVQGADGNMQVLGNPLGGGALFVGAAQEVAHALDEQAVAPVLQHGEGRARWSMVRRAASSRRMGSVR